MGIGKDAPHTPDDEEYPCLTDDERNPSLFHLFVTSVKEKNPRTMQSNQCRLMHVFSFLA